MTCSDECAIINKKANDKASVQRNKQRVLERAKEYRKTEKWKKWKEEYKKTDGYKETMRKADAKPERKIMKVMRTHALREIT